MQRNYGKNYGDLYKPDSLNNHGNGGAPQREGRQEQENRQPPELPKEASDHAEDRISMPEEAPAAPGGGMGKDDVKLQYIDDDPESYANIFDNAKTDVTQADQERLIASLKQLNEGTQLEEVLDIDAVLRYFVVHNFVCNFDSYTGSMVHNYYLYEEDGVLSMLPWDYNLAFGSFQSSSADATELVNFPIDSPVSGGDLESRPMISWIFQDEKATQQYHAYFAQFLAEFFESGSFQQLVDETVELISPYVEKDPTKFCTYEEFQTAAQTLSTFCTLRAESIAGQLDGSIPSTSEGQAADSESLIDASGIQLSDMGSFTGGAPGRGGRERLEDAGHPAPAREDEPSEPSDPARPSTADTALLPDASRSEGTLTLLTAAGQNSGMGQGGPAASQQPFDAGQMPGRSVDAAGQPPGAAQQDAADPGESTPDGSPAGSSEEAGQPEESPAEEQRSQQGREDGSSFSAPAQHPAGESSAHLFLLLGGSFAALLAGLLFAYRFRRR